MRIQTINVVLVMVGMFLTVIAALTLMRLLGLREQSDTAHRRYDECVAAANELMNASDAMTGDARLYVVTGDERYLNTYLTELLEDQRRDKAVSTMKRESDDAKASEDLENALEQSNTLSYRELYAMRLAFEARGHDAMPSTLKDIRISPSHTKLSSADKLELAQTMILGYEYQDFKARIIEEVNACTDELIADLRLRESSVEEEVQRLLFSLLWVAFSHVGLLVIAALANYHLVMRPLQVYAQNIERNEPLESIGAAEVRTVAEAFNRIYEENHRRTLLLRREAQTDALTGLLNRGSYNKLLSHHGDDIALILVDVDLFKEVNDHYGHEIGDRVLRRVAQSLRVHFRTTDYVCRVGGDEFAVILTDINMELRTMIGSKLQAILAELAQEADDLPVVSISAGIAFAVSLPEGTSIYTAADKALYTAKQRGRMRYEFFEEEWA